MDRTFLLRFVETLETVIPPDGSLSLTNVIELWESTLPIDPHPNFFVVYLIGKYLLYETGLYKTTTTVEMIVKLTTAGLSAEEMRPVDDPDVAEIKKSLLNTILYVAVHYPPTYDRPDSPFSIAISNWVIISEKMFSGKLSHAAEFLQSVINQEADNQRLIWSVEKLIKIPHEECPESYLADDSSRVAPALLNAYLRETVLRDPEKVQVIFDAFAMFLAHPRTTRDEILPLLQMIYQFFHLIPVRHPETISTLYALIQNKYYLWPKPYSDLAKEVLGMLSIEHKTPGAAMRHQLIRELPAIIGQTPTGKERVVHVLFDTLSAKAHPLMEIIKYNNNLGENVDVSALQLAMLAGILEVELNMDTDSCGIEYLSSEKLAQYLPEALAILKEAVLMKEDDAANFKKRHLGNLKERIVGDCVLNTNSDSGSAKTTRIPPLKFELYPLEFDNCDPEVDVTPNSFPKFPRRNSCNTILFILNQYRQIKSKRPLTVRIGVVGTDYTLHNIAASYASLKSTHASLLDNLNVQFFYVPSEKSHLAEFLGRQDKWYGRNIVCMLDCYFHLFPSTSCKPSGLSPLSMGLLRQSPVVPKGAADKGKKVAKSKSTDRAEAASPAQTKAKTWANNDAMDGALEEMQRRIAFKKLSEGSSSSVNLNVSPLVTSQPQLSSLSSSSSSSSSSISGPGGSGSPATGRLGGSGGQTNKMLPQKAVTAAQRREAAGASAAKKNVFEYLKLMYGAPERGMLPAFVLRTELEQFFRDARYTVPLTLYSCECWLDDTPYSSYTVPFVRSLELGIDALNRYLEDQGEETDPHKDIKLIAKQLPSFNLRCKQMSMDGVPRAVVVIQPKPWYSVIAASCPVIDDDRTEDANPVLPWLEMHTTELDGKKRRQSRVYHVSEVIAESEKPRGKFSILLDDVLYGPFYKISVTPCMIGETTVRLPLMSFLPF